MDPPYLSHKPILNDFTISASFGTDVVSYNFNPYSLIAF